MVRKLVGCRNILTRGLSGAALFAICSFGVVGTSTVLLGVFSTVALARGGGFHGGGFHGGGFHGGGFRHGRFGFGFWGPVYGYPLYGYPFGYAGYDEGSCYLVGRRVMTRHGWRMRRVEVCD